MSLNRKLPNMNEGGRILASILLMHGDIFFDRATSSVCLRTLIALLHEVDPKRYDKMCRLGIL